MSSRRSFLVSALIAGGSGLVGGGLVLRKHMNDQEIASQLVTFLDYPELANSTGKRILQSETALQEYALGNLIDELLGDAGLSRTLLAELRRDQLLNHLHDSVHRDFVEERIVMIDGWMLSQTDALLCSIMSLVSHKS